MKCKTTSLQPKLFSGSPRRRFKMAHVDAKPKLGHPSLRPTVKLLAVAVASMRGWNQLCLD